jgi:hypothetical protein
MKLPGKKISLLDKQEAVGGTGGYLFDSGCNVSGLRRVHIEHGLYEFERETHPSFIKRIFLEFNNYQHYPTDSNLGTKQERHPQYFDATASNEFSAFDLDPNDSVTKVNVWSNNFAVTGVSFILKSGTTSQIYGLPIKSDTLTTFEGKNDSTMVGIHGCFGAVIDRLGITFAKTIYDDLGSPPNSIDDASGLTLQKEMESSCTVTTNTKEEKEDDESWADVNDRPRKEGKHPN